MVVCVVLHFINIVFCWLNLLLLLFTACAHRYLYMNNLNLLQIYSLAATVVAAAATKKMMVRLRGEHHRESGFIDTMYEIVKMLRSFFSLVAVVYVLTLN